MNPIHGDRARWRIVVWGAALAFAIVLVAIFHKSVFGWFRGDAVRKNAIAATVHTGQLLLDAALDPDPPRENRQSLLLHLTDANGKPVDDASITVVYDMPAMGAMAEMKGGANVSHEGGGHYRAEFDLPMAGTWTLQTSIKAPEGALSQDFAITVGTAGLVPVGGAASGAADAGGETVRIDESRRQMIGVRTAAVIEAPMQKRIRAVGTIAYDESSLSDVNLKVRGWITKLYVNETGQRVSRGQTLFLLYSPEIYNAEQDFLLAKRTALAAPARERLHLLGLEDAQIDALADKGAPSNAVAFVAPASGFIIEKNVVEGASVDPGMRLFRIAALNKVWVETELYESDFPYVRVGGRASVTLDYVPGRVYEAKIAYVYPYLDTKTRTGRVRIELANKNFDLRPGMFANVEIDVDMGMRVQVPASAVVYTGPRRIVFVDVGEGRFKPQEITVGSESNGMDEVLAGLRPGEIVATSGAFLIAAEARIRTAAEYWDNPK